MTSISRRGESGIQLNRFGKHFESGLRFFLARGPIKVLDSPQIILIRLDILRGFRFQPVPLRGKQGDIEFVGRPLGNVRLNTEDLSYILIVGFSPEVDVLLSFDELGNDPDATTGIRGTFPLNGSLQEIIDAQLLTDLSGCFLAAFILDGALT